jgi:hypothetical protein
MPDPTSPSGWLRVAEAYLRGAKACEPGNPGLVLLPLRACDAALKGVLVFLGSTETPRSYGHRLDRLIASIEARGVECSEMGADAAEVARAEYWTPDGSEICEASCETYNPELSDDGDAAARRLFAAERIVAWATNRIRGQ